jgi:hypothetical protein
MIKIKGHKMGRACSRDHREEEYWKVRIKESPWEARGRWESNIKIDLTEIEWGDTDWIDLAQDRDQWRAFVYTAMKLRVP